MNVCQPVTTSGGRVSETARRCATPKQNVLEDDLRIPLLSQGVVQIQQQLPHQRMSSAFDPTHRSSSLAFPAEALIDGKSLFEFGDALTRARDAHQRNQFAFAQQGASRVETGPGEHGSTSCVHDNLLPFAADYDIRNQQVQQQCHMVGFVDSSGGNFQTGNSLHDLQNCSPWRCRELQSLCRYDAPGVFCSDRTGAYEQSNAAVEFEKRCFSGLPQYNVRAVFERGDMDVVGDQYGNLEGKVDDMRFTGQQLNNIGVKVNDWPFSGYHDAHHHDDCGVVANVQQFPSFEIGETRSTRQFQPIVYTDRSVATRLSPVYRLRGNDTSNLYPMSLNARPVPGHCDSIWERHMERNCSHLSQSNRSPELAFRDDSPEQRVTLHPLTLPETSPSPVRKFYPRKLY